MARKHTPKLGVHCQKAREKAGLSRYAAAQKIGKREHDIWRIETDKNVPNVWTLNALAKLYEVTVDYLLNGEPSDEEVTI